MQGPKHVRVLTDASASPILVMKNWLWKKVSCMYTMTLHVIFLTFINSHVKVMTLTFLYSVKSFFVSVYFLILQS
jgi:hypothetical protein